MERKFFEEKVSGYYKHSELFDFFNQIIWNLFLLA